MVRECIKSLSIPDCSENNSRLYANLIRLDFSPRKERAESVEKSKTEKQAKRMENIKARVEAKKKKKVCLLID